MRHFEMHPIYLGYPTGTGTPVLATGKTIKTGSIGFNAGYLRLCSFTQLGNTPIFLNFTGNSSFYVINSTIPCSFGGSVNVIAPNIYIQGGVFNDAAIFTKTGGVPNNNEGKLNIFNGALTINQQSNSGYFMLGYNSNDQFNEDITVNSSGSGGIYLGNATGSGTPELAAGKTIFTGSSGFSDGYLNLYSFTQQGNEPMSLLFTGTNSGIRFARNSLIGGNLTTTSGNIFFDGCTFNGTVNATKTGASSNSSTGGNTFNKTCIITHNGSNSLIMGYQNGDTWNDDVTFNLNGTSRILPAWSSTGNLFNGTIYINSSAGVTGIQFCGGNTTATATLAAGKTIQAGALGINGGYVILKQFTQSGNAPVNLTLSNSASYIQFGPSSSFGGNVTTNSPGVIFYNTVFSGSVYSEKYGSSNDASYGDNIFHGDFTLINNGTGYLLLARYASDIYNGDVHFVKSNSGTFLPNYSNDGYYNGEIKISSSTPVTFGSSGGTARLTGSSTQIISTTTGTPTPVFTKMVVNNSGGNVKLQASINISNNLQLLSGIVHSSPANMLTMLNNSTVDVGDALSTSYIDGPMQYQKSSSGSSVLNFPIGKDSDCRPVALTVNHTSTNLFIYRAQLFNASASALGYTLAPTVDTVSGFHYYTIDRFNSLEEYQTTNGLSGNQTIQIFYGTNDIIDNGYKVTILKTKPSNPNTWFDIGGSPSMAVPFTEGEITSTSSPDAFNSFSRFALGFKKINMLTANTINFSVHPVKDYNYIQWSTTDEQQIVSFTIEKSDDGIHFKPIQTTGRNEATGNKNNQLQFSSKDMNPNEGYNYYRLKQNHTDGTFSYSKTISVYFIKDQHQILIYPNPATNEVYVKGITLPVTQIEWYDAIGKKVGVQTVNTANGVAKLNINLVNGIYTIKYKSGKNEWKTGHVIIKR